MATYTMTFKEMFDSTRGDVGLGSYPIHDEAYRPILNQKILDHFYNREIGFETPDLMRLAIKRRMNEIMPYYAKLYASERIEFDPLSTADITVESDAKQTQKSVSKGESTGTSTTTTKSRAVNSEFPQTMLSENGDYASNATDSASEALAETTGAEAADATQDGESRTTSRTRGYSGSAAELLMSYRSSLLNIDLAVIGELESLFMQIWSSNDVYTEGPFSFVY